MGWTSVRKLREIVANVRTCLAVEMLCAVQGIGLRADIAEPAPAVAAACEVVRSRVPAMYVDREVSEQIMTVEQLIPDICLAAGQSCGGLR
jgi:histidine ammonia-lyase